MVLPTHPNCHFCLRQRYRVTEPLWVLTAGLSGRGYLQVLRRADVQARDVLDPPVDLGHHWVVQQGEPGADKEGGRERKGGRVEGGREK